MLQVVNERRERTLIPSADSDYHGRDRAKDSKCDRHDPQWILTESEIRGRRLIVCGSRDASLLKHGWCRTCRKVAC